MDHSWLKRRSGMNAARSSTSVKPVRTSADGRGLGLTLTAASAAAFLLARAHGPEFLRETPSLSN